MLEVLEFAGLAVLVAAVLLATIRVRHPQGSRCSCGSCQAHRARQTS